MALLERIVSSISNTFTDNTRSGAVQAAIAGSGTPADNVNRASVWPILQRYNNDIANFLFLDPGDQDPEYIWGQTTENAQTIGFAVASTPVRFAANTGFDIHVTTFCDNAHEMVVDLVNADTGVIISFGPLGVVLQDGNPNPSTGFSENAFPYGWQSIRFYSISTGDLPAGNYQIVVSFTAVNYDQYPGLPNPAALAFAIDISAPLPSSGVYNQTQGTFYSTLDAAVTAANPNDHLLLLPGTYDRTTTLTINKPLTLEGWQGSLIVLRAAVIPFLVVSSNITLRGLTMTSDVPYPNEFIQIGGSNNQLIGNTIYGPPQALPMSSWVFNRAVVPQANNMNNLLVQNNTFHTLRTGMYLNPGTNGDILDNVVYNTKGGFLVDSAIFNIVGNSWGTPPNEVDIALFAGTPTGPPYDPVPLLSANNDNANVDDQRS